MDKIDGSTLLIHKVNGKTTIYTRGGGVKGKDVSHLLKYLKIPTLKEGMAVRGEAVLTKEAFLRIGGKSARNVANGIINRKKSFDPASAYELSFFAYRIMNTNLSAEEDINILQNMGFQTPSPVSASNLSKEILENYYNDRKKAAPYEMDGLVIYQNIRREYEIGEAPRHVVAFKTASETAETIVTHVSWEGSKNNLLKPRVHYEAVNLSGADLMVASGYNARFIVDKSIGRGAKILLTRSGDVIPKILSVISPSPYGPDYPDQNITGNYFWNPNEVEFVLEEDNLDVKANKLKYFLKKLDIKNAGAKRARAFVNAGILDIDTLLYITPQQFASIEGIGSKLSNQLYKDLHERITNIDPALLMAVSGHFPNVGETRFNLIFDVYPNFLDFAYDDPAEIEDMIKVIAGFGDKLSSEIALRMKDFADWLQRNPLITVADRNISNIPVTPETMGFQEIGTKLSGMNVLFSGGDYESIAQRIRKESGKVASGMSKKVTHLVVKDRNQRTSKVVKAEQYKIPILTQQEFINEYLS